MRYFIFFLSVLVLGCKEKSVNFYLQKANLDECFYQQAGIIELFQQERFIQLLKPKSVIKLGNSKCNSKITTSSHKGKKFDLFFSVSKENPRQSLQILDFEITNDTIRMNLSVFHPNVIVESKFSIKKNNVFLTNFRQYYIKQRS